MKITQEQIRAVTALPGPKRYSHSVKTIVDWEEAWGLYSNGWAMSATDDGEPVFPLWPAKEYAELCAVEEWSEYQPEPIELDDLVDELLPTLKADGVLVGVFPTSDENGVIPDIDVFMKDLRVELENYE